MPLLNYGALVKKGDVLAEINAPALDSQYAQAKADLESVRAIYALAELTAKRWVALRKNHAVSEQSISVQVAQAKAELAKVRAAEQNVRNFEALIRFKTIVAPYDGVVTVRNINVGDYVNKEGGFSSPNALSNLFTVADVSMMRLFVSVPESPAGPRSGTSVAEPPSRSPRPGREPSSRGEGCDRPPRSGCCAGRSPRSSPSCRTRTT